MLAPVVGAKMLQSLDEHRDDEQHDSRDEFPEHVQLVPEVLGGLWTRCGGAHGGFTQYTGWISHRPRADRLQWPCEPSVWSRRSGPPRCSPSKKAVPMTRSRTGALTSLAAVTGAPATSRSRSARARPYSPSGRVGGISTTRQESRGLSEPRVSSRCQSPSLSCFSRYRTQPVTLYVSSSRLERGAQVYRAWPVSASGVHVFRMVEMNARFGVTLASEASVFSLQR